MYFSPIPRALCVLAVRVAALAAVLAASPLGAQGMYRFKSYGPDQGLTNLTISGISQDATGYLWVATEGGAFRYDGNRFHRFTQADGLTEQIVTRVDALPGGAVLAQTSAGPFVFDGQRFQAVKADAGVQLEGFARAVQGREGSLILGSPSGLARSLDGGKTFSPLRGAPPGAITALGSTGDGREIIAVQRNGSPGDGRPPDYHLLRGREEASGLAWESVTLPPPHNAERYNAILKDAQGRIWFRGPTRLLRLAAWGSPPEDLTAKLPGQRIQLNDGLCLDATGRVWAPTDEGLAMFSPRGDWVMSEAEGLPTPWANVAFVDREGSLWMGAESVHRLQGGFQWRGFTRKQGLPADTIWSVARDAEGRLVAATARGLATLAGNRFSPDPATSDMRTSALIQTREGDLWAIVAEPHNYESFLVMRGRGAAAFQRIQLPGPKIRVYSVLAADPEGGLWAATRPEGMLHIQRKPGGWTVRAEPLPEGHGTDTFTHFRKDAEGLLWLAGSRGLSVREGGRWTRLGVAEGLKEAFVSTMTRGQDGRVWVAYWNVKGLSRLEKGPRGWHAVEHLDQPSQAFSDDIMSLEVAEDGALWMGTTQGVKRWKDGRMEQFGRARGLPGEDCVAGALWLDPGGDVWAGTSSGLAHLDQQAYGGATAPPAARLTLLKDGAGQIRPLGAGIIRVPYRMRSLDFMFEGLSYLDEAHLRPQVRLLGFEDAWRDAENRATRYTTLPPGKYTFEARFLDADGVAGAAVSQAFEILNPWWQSWWFLSLLGLASVGLVGLLIRWRTGLLKRRTLVLEHLVELRTADLQAANTALEEASMADALTGLKNRRYLAFHMPDEEAGVQRAYRTAAIRGEAPRSEDLGLLLVDLDHFKSVNDTHGHAAGDAVLRQAAEVLLQACRETDTVARWGGEEFLVVTRRADRESVEAVARKIHDAFHNHPFTLPDGGVIRRTCSIGFAVHPINPAEPGALHWEETLEAADRCLYAAKNSGRDAWMGIFASWDRPLDAGTPIIPDLPGLVQAGRIELRSSVAAGELRWFG